VVKHVFRHIPYVQSCMIVLHADIIAEDRELEEGISDNFNLIFLILRCPEPLRNLSFQSLLLKFSGVMSEC
jgi:hypothetical protein